MASGEDGGNPSLPRICNRNEPCGKATGKGSPGKAQEVGSRKPEDPDRPAINPSPFRGRGGRNEGTEVEENRCSMGRRRDPVGPGGPAGGRGDPAPAHRGHRDEDRAEGVRAGLLGERRDAGGEGGEKKDPGRGRAPRAPRAGG